MAKSLNKVMLIGNLGRDHEVRYTSSSVPVATFSIATNESWQDQDGNTQERTEWHNIVTWRKLAEICHQYLRKGSKIYIEGRIQTRSYDDKNTGAKKYITEIVASNMIMLDSREGGASGANAFPPPESQVSPTEGGKQEGDLLFYPTPAQVVHRVMHSVSAVWECVVRMSANGLLCNALAGYLNQVVVFWLCTGAVDELCMGKSPSHPSGVRV